LPPPGRAVYEQEVAALQEDVRAFTRMLAEHGADWVTLEHKFGREGAPAVDVTLPRGGTIKVSGAIDRIDRRKNGLVIIDYKTGSTFEYDARSRVYRGGRRLQHVLYVAVAEQLLDEPVVAAEYHFPTLRARNHVAAYTRDDLREGLDVVERLIDLAAGGLFHPTDNADDCKICDYAAVCRVHVPENGNPQSPPVEWMRTHGAAHEILETLRELRGL
jgi:CRISPR/Cas system-associated exonuclease Cas4 (RecB family)